jgi:integrase
LGSAAKVPLALARDRAAKARSQIEAGIDPVAERRKAAGVPTFREAAALVHAETRKGWRNGKHDKQWLASLDAHCFPAIGDVAVSELDGPAVRDVLSAIWLTKPETARRIRQRVIAIADWSVAKGYRDAPLAMAAIDKSLPRQRRSDKHHAAMPFTDVPEFLTTLRSRESVGRLALEFLILTAARSGEVRGATWAEIDLEGALWTIPADRMKAGKEHVIPLSDAALQVLDRAKPLRSMAAGNGGLIFPGLKSGKPVSDMTLTKVMRDAGLAAVPHGFRSSFKDWASETTSFANELSEAALAHAIPNKSEAAYRRGNLLDKRRVMMTAWLSIAKALRAVCSGWRLMPRGGRRLGAGRPKGSAHLTKAQRLLIGLACEREWHRRYYPKPPFAAEYLRAYGLYKRLQREYRQRARRSKARRQGVPLRLAQARRTAEAAGDTLRALAARRYARPQSGLKSQITREQSIASYGRFHKLVSPRMVRSCWSEFLALKRRHPGRLTRLIDWQLSPVPILFSLPENQPRAYLGVR